MIGSGLKKLAQENGMKVAHGVAYGSLGGFAATMSEGAGYKRIVFATTFSDAAKKETLMQQIGQANVEKTYRVQQLNVTGKAILVDFLDNPGTMKKITEFLEWFLPLLRESSAAPSNVCPECGSEVIGGRWILVDGVAYCMHESCADGVQRQIQENDSHRKESDTGSYFKGLLGALAGSLIGSVLWAVILYLGYVASIVGLAIGWLAEKGYNLLHGKQGKGKVVILVLAVILGVLIGNFLPDVVTLVGMINSGELAELSVAEVPMLILLLLAEDAEYRGAVIKNILMGLLFAALGVYALIRKTSQEVADTKVIVLE